jgi:cellulose synthase (UDP-forming)
MNTLLALGFFGGVVLLASPYLRRESRVVRFLVIAFSLTMTARYIYWRITSSLPDWQFSAFPVLAYAFFAVEMTATYLAVKDLLLLKRTTDRTAEVERQLDWYGESAPRLDILIATYNEPWEVLEKTVVGATSQNYPNYCVWILDDGNRGWVSEKAAEWGIGYITRTDNAHYKAGNLNNGIATIRASGVELEFIALLDADFVARPEFLRRSLALMQSKDVGIVQTPQCFYNPDPYQRAFGGVMRWPDEQRAFFDVWLPALDALGLATCCGTSCLIRAAALEAIGGVPTESVCEDTLTSIKMRRKGFKTLYLRERLAVGLAPEGIGEFLTQRARWLAGGVQNSRVFGAGPGVRARILYWLTLWRMALYGFMRPAWISLCIVYWFTGVFVVRATDFNEALSYFGPLWLDRLFQGWLSAGTRMLFVSDAFWSLLSPLWMKETYRAIVGSKARFKVTDKAVHRDKTVVHWQVLPFHGLLAGLLLAGLLYTLIDPTAPAHHTGFLQANTAMTLYYLAVMVAGVIPAVEGPRRRTADRYPTNEPIMAYVDGKSLRWECRNVSLGGVLVQTHGCPDVPAILDLQLGELGPIRATLVRKLPRGQAAFAFRAPELRVDLIRKLYCTDGYIPHPRRWGLGAAVTGFFRRLLT